MSERERERERERAEKEAEQFYHTQRSRLTYVLCLIVLLAKKKCARHQPTETNSLTHCPLTKTEKVLAHTHTSASTDSIFSLFPYFIARSMCGASFFSLSLRPHQLETETNVTNFAHFCICSLPYTVSPCEFLFCLSRENVFSFAFFVLSLPTCILCVLNKKVL